MRQNLRTLLYVHTQISMEGHTGKNKYTFALYSAYTHEQNSSISNSIFISAVSKHHKIRLQSSLMSSTHEARDLQQQLSLRRSDHQSRPDRRDPPSQLERKLNQLMRRLCGPRCCCCCCLLLLSPVMTVLINLLVPLRIRRYNAY